MYTRYQHFVFFGGKYHRFGDPITDADDRQARSCAGGSTKGLTEHAVSYTLMGKTNPNLRVLAVGFWGFLWFLMFLDCIVFIIHS